MQCSNNLLVYIVYLVYNYIQFTVKSGRSSPGVFNGRKPTIDPGGFTFGFRKRNGQLMSSFLIEYRVTIKLRKWFYQSLLNLSITLIGRGDSISHSQTGSYPIPFYSPQKRSLSGLQYDQQTDTMWSYNFYYGVVMRPVSIVLLFRLL